MSDIFTAPDDGGDLKSSDFTTSMADRLGAQWADTLDPKNSLSGMWIARRAREAAAGGEDIAPVGGFGEVDVFSGQSLDERQQIADARRAAIPDISQADAKLMIKQEGLSESDIHLGEAPTHKLPVLKMRIDEAHTRRDRQAAIERGPQGFFPGALGLVTSLGVGMIDPVNAAAFSIPVIGEARMGKVIAAAGDSILARGTARAGQGAAQGAFGTALLQPADWWLHTNDGKDYTFAQAMESVIMGAGMGAGFHAIPGGVRDWRARRRGEPLEGSPQDLLLRGLMTGTHVPAEALHEDGVPLDEVPGIGPVIRSRNDAMPVHPAEVLADLPPAAREDAVHAAMADIMADHPVRSAELLQIAADHDPRIAESFEAWHGSPHDFERFNAGHIGTGEGAQAYGQGLYFAENEKVARGYQRATSDKAFVNKVAELYDEGFSPDDAWAEIKDNWQDFTPAEQRLMNALEKDSWLGFDYPHQAVNAALRDIKSFDASPETVAAAREVGNIYRVKINANHDHMLDWDKPLSEQPEAVKRVFAPYAEQFGADAKMGALIKIMSSRGAGMKGVSEQLRDAGIPGIKYLDQHSRGAGEGSRNFVVFDDKHIEITHKNGEPVKREDLKAEHEAKLAKDRADAEAAVTKHVTAKAPTGRAAANPETWSLFEYLASKGGLKPDPELEAIFGNSRGPFVPGFGSLIRKGGMPIDQALRSAKDGRYLFDAADVTGAEGKLTPRDLLDKIDDENRKRKVYRIDHTPAADRAIDTEEEAQHILGALHTEIEAATGQSGVHIDPALEARVVEIVQKEGIHDVMEAYERAIMEDRERYDATAEARRADEKDRSIPGWDVPHDAGAASPRGQTAEGIGGPAGRAEPGEGASVGQQPRASGAGDRAQTQAKLRSSPAVAAADPRWRDLAEAKPDHNEPETLAESEAAAKLPEPDSLVPEKSLTALEKAAADAEIVWRQLEPTLTESERALVHEVMDQLRVDKETRERIITDGAACLAGAIG
jgi:hypothetical protein